MCARRWREAKKQHRSSMPRIATFRFLKPQSGAALVSLRKVDRESPALSANPQFLKIINTAGKEVRAGKTTSLEALQKKFGATAPNKRMARTRKTPA
jgi:hypothetical protein